MTAETKYARHEANKLANKRTYTIDFALANAHNINNHQRSRLALYIHILVFMYMCSVGARVCACVYVIFIWNGLDLEFLRWFFRYTLDVFTQSPFAMPLQI